MSADLEFWNDTPTKQAMQKYMAKVTDPDGPGYVSPEERIAVFDNDGTLWCEQPAQPQADFIIRRLAAMAEADPTLRDQQPWQAAYAGNMGWFSDAVVKHYQGDETKVKVLLGGILKAFDAMTVEDFEDAAAAFMGQTKHPSLDVPYLEATFQPMVELLHYLEEYGFTVYIVSGGGRDFVRPISQQLYGIPPERVIGSAVKLEFQVDSEGAEILRQPGLDVIDDGPAKPVEIWERIGRRPILAVGNANGDIPMLQYAQGGVYESLCLVVDHDDADREFKYSAGAENLMRMAQEQDWTVISVKDDWRNVFAFQS